MAFLPLSGSQSGIGWIRIIADTSYTTAEAEVSPGGIGADIRAPIHLQFEVGDGIEIEISVVEQSLGDSIDGTLRHADTKTAGVGTGAGCETRHDGENHRSDRDRSS